MKEYFIEVILKILDTYLVLLGAYDIYKDKSLNEKYAYVALIKDANIEKLIDECVTKDDQVNLIYKIFWYTRKYRRNIKCSIKVSKDWLDIYISDVYIKFIYNGDNLEIERLVLDNSFITIMEGINFNLHVTIYPNNAVYNQLTWESNNTEVCDVDQEGNVTTKKAGNATISVKATNGIYAMCIVTVIANFNDVIDTVNDMSQDLANIQDDMVSLNSNVASISGSVVNLNNRTEMIENKIETMFYVKDNTLYIKNKEN